MSHPYWPQPRYLYHRALPHGVYPAAMGGYSYGSLSRRRHYALPDYVAAEPTGLEGEENLQTNPFEWGTTYYGFGEIELIIGDYKVTCAPEVFISKFVGYIPDKILFIPMSPVKTILQKELSKLSNTLLNELMKTVAKGQAAFSTWYKVNISYNVEQATGIPQSVINLLPDELYKAAKSALDSCKIPIPQTPPYSKGHPCVVASDCKSGLTCIPLPLIPGTQPVSACLEPLTVETGFHIDPGALQMLAQQQVLQAQMPTQVQITPTKTGAGTAVVVGAGLLAALFLLR